MEIDGSDRTGPRTGESHGDKDGEMEIDSEE